MYLSLIGHVISAKVLASFHAQLATRAVADSHRSRRKCSSILLCTRYYMYAHPLLVHANIFVQFINFILYSGVSANHQP